jgi:hypothetical protein
MPSLVSEPSPVSPHGLPLSGQHEQGQAIALEGRLQGILHRLVALVVGRLQPDRKARMIVDDRQRMQLSPSHRHLALEVHLPQHVGLRVLEALPGLLPGATRGTLLRRRISVMVEGEGGTTPCRASVAAILRPPHTGFSRRTSSTAASSSGSVRLGDRRGRRERSDSPATPSRR